MTRDDSATLIGTRVTPTSCVWLATVDNRQWLVTNDVVVQELLPTSPLWRPQGHTGMHWSTWVRALRN